MRLGNLRTWGTSRVRWVDRQVLRRPIVVAPVTASLLVAAVVIGWVSTMGPPPRTYSVASADGTVAAQQLAFFSDHYTALYSRSGSRAGENLRSGPMFGYQLDDQPSGRGGRLAFISREGTGERDGEVFYWDGASRRRMTSDTAVDSEPDISPDGTRIVFASNRSGSWDIWVVDTRTRDLKQLTSDAAEDSWPRWSPNGRSIAFSSRRDDPAGDIYTMPAAGGTPTRVTTDPAADTQPAWSADSKRLAFTTTRWEAAGAVAVMPAGGGATTRIVVGSEPVWSLKDTTGNTLTFVDRGVTSTGTVYSVAATAGATPVVVEPPSTGNERHPTWLDTATLITAYDQDGTAAPDNSGQPVYTADVWSAGADGSAMTNVTNRQNLVERAPAYSPDGRFVAYQKEHVYGEIEGEPETNFVIEVADADGGNPRELVAPGLDYGDVDPAWSPDGTLIAFARKFVENNFVVGQIWVVDAITGAQRAVVRCGGFMYTGEFYDAHFCDDGEPAWSPDGRHLAYTRTFYNGINSGPSPSASASPSPSPSASASPSPSRTLDPPIILGLTTGLGTGPRGETAAGNSRVWTVDVTARYQFGVQERMSAKTDYGAMDLGPTWAPDSQSIVFARDGNALMRVALDTSRTTSTLVRANDGSESAVRGITSPAYSLDGRTIAFAACSSAATVCGGLARTGGYPASDIYTVPSGGGAPTVIISEPGEDSQPAYRPSADVSLALQANPSSVPLNGKGAVIQAVATNHGWVSSLNSTVELTVVSGLKPTAIRASSGTCDLKTLTCSVGSIEVGRQVTVTVEATGVALGTAVVTGEVSSTRYDPDLSDNSGRTSVIVGPEADISVAVSATPEVGYVGGDPLVVTYTVTNRGSFDSAQSTLAMDLPAGMVTAIEATPAAAGRTCDTAGRTCALGTIAPTSTSGSNAITVKVTLDPKAAINTLVRGTVAAATDGDPGNNTATAAIRVLTPTLRTTPTSGKPGFLPMVIGANFPPGAQITLVWDRGLTQRTRPVTVAADGTFTAPMMVFHKDLLGMRTLRATAAASTPSGTRFSAVTCTYLVVSGQDEPQNWLYRR